MAAIDRLLVECKTMDDFGQIVSEEDVEAIWRDEKALTQEQINNLFWKSATPTVLERLFKEVLALGATENKAIEIVSGAFRQAMSESGH